MHHGGPPMAYFDEIDRQATVVCTNGPLLSSRCCATLFNDDQQ